jgi:cytochrome oxidase Cu insertion factor (SCO1/SenC/PrrC family)
MATPQVSAGDSTSRDDLRRLRPLFWVALVALVVLAIGVVLVSRGRQASPSAVAASAGTAGIEAPVAAWRAGARPAPGFRLVDQVGRGVSLAGLRGRPVIVTFVDPLCRNLCPLEAKQLNVMVRSLPARSRPVVVAVSVDIYGDSRADLVQDVSKWSLVPQWRWAVGSRGELARVWHDYQVAVLVTTKRIAGVTVHEITHTEEAYVIDAHGYERALFIWPFRGRDVRALVTRLTPRASQPS